jgi:NNP family nitrate/nitrite transporter-like MFS transporter
MMTVTFLVTHVLNARGPDGWRLIFPIFAISTLLMALVYWFFTSDSPYGQQKGVSMPAIVAVYRSGVVVWLVPYLYWVSFGTLTFFASAMPTYLVDRWHVDAVQASMMYVPLLVVCVAFTRPLGGWLADRFDVLRMLGWLFGFMVVLAVVMTMQISVQFELFAIYGLALLAGTAAAAVVKLIPLYFRQVGAVSGLAKAAGAACGFTMTVTLAASKNLLGGYTVGFAIWALMNAAAFYIAFSRVGFRHAKPDIEATPSGGHSNIDAGVRAHGQA